MSRIHPNNFKTTLAADCSNVATTITLTDNLPTIAAGEYIVITVTDNVNYELFKIDSNSGAPTYTIVSRGIEGTSAQNWVTGQQVSIRVTKGSIDDKQDLLDNVTPSTVTLVAGDAILIKDASDSNKFKQALASDFTALNALEKIGVATASSSTELTFTGLGNYLKITFVFSDLLISTDGVGTANSGLYLQTSTNNGSSYDSGASDYAWTQAVGHAGGSGANPSYVNGTTQIVCIQNGGSYGLDKDTGGGIYGEVDLYNPTGTSYRFFKIQLVYMQNQGSCAHVFGSGVRKASSDVDAVRFYTSTGNWVSGTITAYGLKK